MIKQSSILTGVSYLLTATFLYGLFGILSRTVGLTIPIFYQNATRYIIASVILGFVVLYQHAWSTVQKKDWIIIIARNIAGSIAFLTFFFAVLHASLATTYFIFYGASTIVGFLLGHIWFSEHITKIKAASLILALVGILIVYQVNALSISAFYFFVTFLSGTTTAIWFVISKIVSGRYSASYLSFLDNAISIVTFSALSIVTHEHWSVPDLSSAWLASNGLGVFFVGTGLLVVEGFKRIEAQIGSIIMLSEIIFAIFFGWLFYRETISLFTFVGGVLIIIAIILPELYSRNRS